jgi:hypothetical protein
MSWTRISLGISSSEGREYGCAVKDCGVWHWRVMIRFGSL